MRPTPTVPVLAVMCCALSTACEASLLEPGEMEIVVPEGADPLLAVVRTQVLKHPESGPDETLVDEPRAVRRFSVGRGKPGAFEFSGFDAQDQLHAWGRSVPIAPAGIAGMVLPLFVSQTGSFAVAPGDLSNAPGPTPLTAVLAGRYVTVFTPATDRVRATSYDLGLWGRTQGSLDISCPASPCRFDSIAILGKVALAVGPDWAIWFDLLQGESGDVEKPAGLPSWADIAGGKTLFTDDGGAIIVGPTRDTPSEWALSLDAELELTALRFTAPRAGAAAAWLSGRGLVLAAGSDSATGVELVPTGASSAVPLAYAPDPVVGAALVAVGDLLLRVGGYDGQNAAPTVALSTSCGSDCAPEAMGPAVQLARASAFAVASSVVLVVGHDSGGETRAMRLENDTVLPLPLVNPRRDAQALQLPTGHVAVLGGTRLDGDLAASLELFGR